MTTQEAIDHFGGITRLARELEISTQAIYLWGDRPPLGRQYEIEVKTSGELRADMGAAKNGGAA